ncbi:hypothetical protein TSAR_008246 [Trichomalopsis sarcophagae]|uniref:Uncharacterized protein n=1 Tax=Trichomalopsis sarcophagae TaxID=543379 RepID=A0A232FLI2_9HYME|nr:hypothetical protein TSAR_008246 [Trichomalopsis sarcophagae]
MNKMESEVKLRLQNLDKILVDYYQLYSEIEKETAVYLNCKAKQEKRIAIIEEEVKKIKILLEYNASQDNKIRELEEEVKKLRIWQEANKSRILAVEPSKAENKEKTSFLMQTQNIINDEYVNHFINDKLSTKPTAKSAFTTLTQAQKTSDNANDIIIRQKSTEAKAENATKSAARAEKTNDGKLNGLTYCKERTKTKIKVGTRLYNQSQKNNDVNMNSLCNTKEKKKHEIESSTGSSTQAEKTSSSNDFSKSECENCRPHDKNLVATKGKKWNNHNINTWLEQKLKLNVNIKAWKLTVFGEYNHLEFEALEHKQFLWQNRDKWEEEGVWSWFEC